MTLGICRDGPEPLGTLCPFEKAPGTHEASEPEKGSNAKGTPRTFAERWASAVTDMDLTPRRAVTAPPPIASFEQMLREGHVVLADATLREALGPDFDGRDLEVGGFCVSLHRWEGGWMGFAGDGCNHDMIPGADDYALASPKKRGATWSFESEWGPSIRITKSAGALSVTVSDLETGAWSPPVEVRPSESAHLRDRRWHRDAVQAFLEQAGAPEPRLVERRLGQWEYEQQPLPRCSLWAWRCDPGKPTLVCGERGESEHLLIRRQGETFTFERVSGQLGMNKCRIGPFSGISPPPR